MGAEYIAGNLGNSMHAFLLDLPKLDFAAIIPKGDYVTMCLIGDRITNEFVEGFVKNPVVSEYLSGSDDRSPPAAALRSPAWGTPSGLLETGWCFSATAAWPD